MKIKKISLKNYRNYDVLELNFCDRVNIIIGDNAQGKTNLLESIYVLAITKSFLSVNDKNLIKFNNKFSRIKGIIESGKKKSTLEVLINETGKVVKSNNLEIKKLSDYISLMNVIVFSSDNIRMIKESPASRRKYLNVQISQMDRKYLKTLNDYNLILRQRNEFLKIINIKKISDMDYLEILNNKYVELSIKIFEYRKKYIDDINKYIDDIFLSIAGKDNLKISYVSNIEISSDKGEMEKLFLKKLNDNLNKEIQYRMTLYGPNRDDFYFSLDSKNLSLYGSQGQMRSAILALKLSEVNLFYESTNEMPILLLDDIFSELDLKKRINILKYLDNNIQTIITTTDINDIDKNIVKVSNVYKVENGKIISREII